MPKGKKNSSVKTVIALMDPRRHT